MSDKGRRMLDEALGLALHGDLAQGRERLFALAEEDPEAAARIFLAGLLFCQEGESGRARLLQRLAPAGAPLALRLRALAGVGPAPEEMLERLQGFLERIQSHRRQMEAPAPTPPHADLEAQIARLEAWHRTLLARLAPETPPPPDHAAALARLEAFHRKLLARLAPETPPPPDHAAALARLEAFHQNLLARLAPSSDDSRQLLARLEAFQLKLRARQEALAALERLTSFHLCLQRDLADAAASI